MGEDRVRFTVSMPREMVDELRALAAANGRSLMAQTGRMLRESLAEEAANDVSRMSRRERFFFYLRGGPR